MTLSILPTAILKKNLKLYKRKRNFVRDNSYKSDKVFESKSLKLLYVYDKFSNTNVPDKIGRKLGLRQSVEFQTVELLKIKKIIPNLRDITHADLIHTHHTKSSFLISILLIIFKLLGNSKIRRVHTIHRDISLLSWLSKATYRFLILPNCDLIICNSYATKRALAQFYKDNRCAVIYNGVDVELFNLNNSFHSTKQLKLVSVGRLIPIKNQALIIRAVHECIKKGIEIELTIIGNGPEKSKLQNLIKELNLGSRVRLIGEIPNNKLPEHLKTAKIYIAASHSEGFGNATVEAAVSGLNVIASKIDVHLEIGSGQFIFFDPSSLEDLANCLEEVAIKNKLRPSNDIRQHFLRFSETTCVEKHLKVYMGLKNETDTQI